MTRRPNEGMTGIAVAAGCVVVVLGAGLLLGGCSGTPRSRAEAEPARPTTSLTPRRSPTMDPFAARPGTIAASHDEAPNFSLFGDTSPASANDPIDGRNFDPTENIRQVSFATEGADFDPAVSRDGNLLFFSSTRHRETADIYVQAVDGASVTQLTSDPAHDVMPAISPDQQRIAFASNRNGSWDIYIMNAEGGQATQITSEPSHELHPTFSPDGRFLAYCRLSERSSRWEIWMVDLERPAVKTFLTFGLFPEWHPSADQLLFQRSRDRGNQFFSVWTVDVRNGESSRPTEVLSSSVAAIINPTWSPDGRFIACSTAFVPDGTAGDPSAPGSGGAFSSERPQFADIWLVSADGQTRINLTGGWFVNTMPTWGARSELYFVSNRNGVDTVWSISPEQGIRAAGMKPPRANRGVATAVETGEDGQ